MLETQQITGDMFIFKSKTLWLGTLNLWMGLFSKFHHRVIRKWIIGSLKNFQVSLFIGLFFVLFGEKSKSPARVCVCACVCVHRRGESSGRSVGKGMVGVVHSRLLVHPCFIYALLWSCSPNTVTLKNKPSTFFQEPGKGVVRMHTMREETWWAPLCCGRLSANVFFHSGPCSHLPREMLTAYKHWTI